MKLKAREHLRVRKPDGELLKEEGEIVEMGPYWKRRLLDGDVEIVEEGKVLKEKKSTKKSKDEEGES